MNCPREYLWFVERLLREYPRDTAELKSLEEVIVACCHLPVISEVLREGSSETEPERVTVAKEQNKRYQWLTNRVLKIKKGLAILTKQERDIAKALYWDDMIIREVAEAFHLNERWVKRTRVHFLHKLSRVFIPLWVG
jgi:DNA-directed RNA polymerase specialized sigma subunit